MAYHITPEAKTLHLNLSGTVDLSSTAEIKDAILQEPKAGYQRLEIDGADIDYLDSSAVALLLFIRRMSQEQGLLFEISRLSAAAEKVIALAGLQGMLQASHTAQAGTPPADEAPLPALDFSLDNPVPAESSADALDISLDNWFNAPLESESEEDGIEMDKNP